MDSNSGIESDVNQKSIDIFVLDTRKRVILRKE